jgi:pimeloyl-ACP methyl ester carboxylesterase
VVSIIDPNGTDPALKQMVVIGHSQGGLIAKLMAVDSDGNWWEKLTGVPFEEFDFPPDQEELLRSSMDFDPVAEVKRVIFLATPHRGSFQADRWLTRFIAKTIAMPGELVGLNESLVKSAGKLPKELQARIPTSLDNMRASNPFLQLLCGTPLAPGVKAHSIIAIDDADPAHPEDADDGIVKYKSAHLDGVESELLVPTGHSCQADPRSIAEVRRILLLHLRESGILSTAGAAR